MIPRTTGRMTLDFISGRPLFSYAIYAPTTTRIVTIKIDRAISAYLQNKDLHRCISHLLPGLPASVKRVLLPVSELFLLHSSITVWLRQEIGKGNVEQLLHV